MKDTTSTSVRTAPKSSSNNNNNTVGIQLLSPTSLEVARSTVAPRPARVTTAKGSAFDFNSFTLESVRSTTTVPVHSSVYSHDTNSVSGGGPHRKGSAASSDSASCLSSQAEKFADALDAQPRFDGMNSFHTMRSTEDFDALEHQRRHPSMLSTVVGGMPVVPLAVRKKTAVAMLGWLQKRKGLVLKRWKAYYCLLRDDDQLCLYTSEDTVNGRVEQRLQVLRVLLTDKSDAFHVIGVGSDGTPRKDEFRAAHSVDWSRWFRAFRGYLDAVSLQGVMARKPELADLSPTSSRGSEDSFDNNSSSLVGGSYVTVGVSAFGSKSAGNNNSNASTLRIQRRSVATQRADATRGSFDRSSVEEPRPTLSAISAFAGVSSWTSESHQDAAKIDALSSASDCPPIDSRDDQKRASESTASRDSDVLKPSPFSW